MLDLMKRATQRHIRLALLDHSWSQKCLEHLVPEPMFDLEIAYYQAVLTGFEIVLTHNPQRNRLLFKMNSK